MARRTDYSAPALEKGMDILELLAEAESGLTVSEISLSLKRRMSELFRIVVVLERRRWLYKCPETSRYSVSYHVLRVAHRGTPARTLTSAAAPLMQQLSRSVDQSCHLVVRSGAQALVILRQENPLRHANLSVRQGAVIDLLTSCSGRVLLAHMDKEARDTLLKSARRPRALTRGRLDRALDRIRRRGFEVQRSPITAGVTDISYPIRDFGGTVLAALTVPYLHARDGSLPTTVEQTRRHLGDTARRISLALGATG
jgi:DNA-binding IclR family transcriptional regulator